MSAITKLLALVPGSWIRAASSLHWRFPVLRPLHEAIADRYRGVDGVIARGVGQGLRFNAARSYAGYLMGTWEPTTQEAFRTFVAPGNVLYDGGASVGFWTVLAARLVGASGRVVSFEPLQENADRIAHNVRLNGFANVQIERIALGAVDGTETFLVSADAGWGRLGGPGAALNQKVAEMPVAVRSIDSLVAAGEIPPPDVIKLDVEGAEAAVLQGAMETIHRKRPVLLIELHDTAREVTPLLSELGYAGTIALGAGASSEMDPDYVFAVPRESERLVQRLQTLQAR